MVSKDSRQGNSVVFLFSRNDCSVLETSVWESSVKISFSSQLASCLSKKGNLCFQATSYLSQKDWEAIAINSVDWIKRWPYRRFAGRTLIEWLRLEDFSLWWQLEAVLYYTQRENNARGFYMATRLAYIVRRIVEQEAPAMVYFVDRENLETRIVKYLLEALGVPFQPVVCSHSSTIKERMVYAFETGFVHRLLSLWLYMQRALRGVIYHLSGLWRQAARRNSLRVLLLSEQGNGVRAYRHPSSGELRYGDLYFAGLQEELLTDDTVEVAELQLRIPNVGKASRRKDLRQILLNSELYAPIEGFLRWQHLLTIRCARRRLRQVWKALQGDAEFRASFGVEGIDLFPIMREQVRALLLRDSVICLRRTLAYREALRRLEPDVVLMNRHKATMVDACHLEGVPLVEMEHGTWSHFPAVLLRYYQHLDSVHGNLTRTFPTAIAVWGPYMYHLLRQWNYPQERIVVTGYPTYDRLPRLSEAEVSFFARELGLDPMKKTVVYMTGNPWMELYHTPQEQVKTARALLSAVKDLPEVRLVIKVHQYDNAELYRQLQSELGAESYSMVLQKCDTSLLIAACDVVVAKGSSTLLEAAIAGKAVIMFNFTSKPDMFEFRNYDIGLYINHDSEISVALQSVLYDDSLQMRMDEARKDFVQQWANGTDGQASSRLAALLKSLGETTREGR